MRNLVIIGAVESTEVAIRAAQAVQGWRVRMIVTLPEDRAARHSDFRDLVDPAHAVGAALVRTAQVNAPDVLKQITAAQPDLLLVVGWSQICGPAFLDILPGRVLGYHPAALPRLRGRAAIPWTILNDEPITAGTLFWIDEGVDSGPIFEQRFFHVAPDETASSLYEKHMIVLGAMVGSALARLHIGDADGIAQDDRYGTYAARRTAADGEIDWSLPTASIDRQIRAVGRPYPGAFTQHAGGRLTLWKAAAVAGGSRYLAAPGQIVQRRGNEFFVKTTDGLICVTEWESETMTLPKLHTMLGSLS